MRIAFMIKALDSESKVIDRIMEGQKVEMEHKTTFNRIANYLEDKKKLPPDELMAQWIAEDHIREYKNYYEYLSKMENKLKEKHHGKRK
jgi:hypothetical protein